MTLTHKSDIHKIAPVVGCYPEKMSRSGKEHIISWHVLLLPPRPIWSAIFGTYSAVNFPMSSTMSPRLDPSNSTTRFSTWGKWPCVRCDLCNMVGHSQSWKPTFSPHVIAQAILHQVGFECPDKYKLRVRTLSVELNYTVSLWKKTTPFETSKSLADMRKKQKMYCPTSHEQRGCNQIFCEVNYIFFQNRGTTGRTSKEPNNEHSI